MLVSEIHPVTKGIMRTIFLMYTRKNYTTFKLRCRRIYILKKKKQEKTRKKKEAVYDSDIPVTLEQGQGCQTWYELEEPEQGYHNDNNNITNLNNVCDRANHKLFFFFVKSGNTSSYIP